MWKEQTSSLLVGVNRTDLAPTNDEFNEYSFILVGAAAVIFDHFLQPTL
jgi:hypothetical protein